METLADLEAQAARFAGAADIIVEGLRRLAAYQDIAYARLYLDRLAPIAQADGRAQAEGRLLRETARHLAVRMSYEDVIRVAQAKIAPDRIARIVAQAGGKPGEPVAIIEFLKPGIEEICQILPPSLARTDPAPRRAPGLDQPLPLGHGNQDHIGHRLSQVPDARQAAALPAPQLPLPGGAGRDRSLARADRRGFGKIRDAWRSKSRNAHG